MTGYEVWLYGSVARGDADELSDVDVLIAGPAPSSLIEEYRASFGYRLSLSKYSWTELKKMAHYGSLFLLHLQMEGRPLEANAENPRLERLLDQLPHYAHARRDLASFRQTLSDVRTSLTGDCSPIFEMAIVGTLIRHASVLGCYTIGQPTFGRSRPMETFVAAVGLDPALPSHLRELYAFRMSYARGMHPPRHVHPEEVAKWVKVAESYLNVLEDKVDDFCRSVS